MDQNVEQMIESYLSGTLTAEEKRIFETQLKEDPLLAQSLQDQIRSQLSLDAQGDLLLKEKLKARADQNFDEEAFHLANPSRSRAPWFLAVAAAFLVIAVLAWLLQEDPRPLDLQQMYTENYQPLSAPGSRSDTNKTDLWRKGTEAYMKRDYEGAIASWRQYLADTADGEVALYLGVSYMLAEKADSAHYYLAEVPKTHTDAQRASWFQALNAMKSGNQAALQGHLKTIADWPGHYKQQMAKELLANGLR